MLLNRGTEMSCNVFANNSSHFTHCSIRDNDSSRGFYYRRVFNIITVKFLLHAVLYEY